MSPRLNTHNAWSKYIENDVEQKAMIAGLIVANKHYKKVAFESMAEIYRINAELTAKESETLHDRPLQIMGATYADNNTFKTIVGEIITGTKMHQMSCWVK